MRMFTIYENPSDYPGRFVLRAWTITPLGPIPDEIPLLVKPTIEEVRCGIPSWRYVRMERSRDDDPCIVETWI